MWLLLTRKNKLLFKKKLNFFTLMINTNNLSLAIIKMQESEI